MKTLIAVTPAAALFLSLTGHLSAALAVGYVLAIAAGVYLTRESRQ